MFENPVEVVIDTLNPTREKREDGALTIKLIVEGAFTDSMREDLAELVDGILPEDGEPPTFGSVSLDKEYENRHVTIFQGKGAKPKVDRNGVAIKSINLIKQEANALALRFAVYLGPVSPPEANFLINQFGHLVTMSIQESQQELGLVD